MVFTYIAVCKIDQFFKGLYPIGIRPCFCYLTDLAMITFNILWYSLQIAGICWKYLDSLSLFSCQNSITTGNYLPPSFIQLEELIFSRFFIDYLIKAFLIFRELLQSLGTNILEEVAYLMYNTKLYSSIGINVLNRFRKTFQVVYIDNENIFNSTVLKNCQHIELEVCVLSP